MLMDLYGTPTSPYTRVVRIFARELGYDLPLKEMSWRKTPDELFQLNPAGRIPLLVDDGRKVFESRIIAAYLQAKDGRNPSPDFRPLGGAGRWEEENLVSLAYAAMDGGVVRGVLSDPPAATHPYLDRSLKRAATCLASLDAAAQQGYLVDAGSFGMAEAALMAAGDYLEGRVKMDFARYPNLNAIRGRYADRPSVRETKPSY